MSEQQIPDPPEAIEPPPEIIASIVASIRGGSTDPTDDQIAAFEAYRARVSLADAEARERSRLAAERRQAEADQQAQEAAQQRAKERSEALKARIAAKSADVDRQLLESIHRHAQAADARRIAVEREFQRRARQAAINQTIDEIWQMNNPPPPVAVECVEIDPDGSPHLGSPDFNPNHPAWTLKPRGEQLRPTFTLFAL